MLLKNLQIQNYKNLQNFDWELLEDERSQVICIIGENGAGKSNLLEAMVHIFTGLIYFIEEKPKFNFKIVYELDGAEIEIAGSIDSKFEASDGYYIISRDGRIVDIEQTKEEFAGQRYVGATESRSTLFPENVIVYYSGYSKRMTRLFEGINFEYSKVFRQGKTAALPALLMIEPVHFKMILLSLFSYDPTFDSIYRDFFLKNFEIEGISSFSFKIIKHSESVKDKVYADYFDTKGVIRAFLEALDEIQILENEITGNGGPIKTTSPKTPTYISSVTYSYVTHNSLLKLKEKFGYESDIFKLLNLLNQSGNLSEISISIKKKGIPNPISFDDLSEGEQQLLAIKGCVELLWGKSNIFLWDEPDTYLNPRWQWNLIPDLEKQLMDKKEDQFILTTHSPVLISTAKRGVFEMELGKLSTIYNTYGLTVNEILEKQDIEIQAEDVKKMYDDYISLIQSGQGKSEGALRLRSEVEKLWGSNHPELLKANIFLKYYE